MANKITISFKQTTKDMRLYTYIKSQEEYSEFVKAAIEFYIKHLNREVKKWLI